MLQGAEFTMLCKEKNMDPNAQPNIRLVSEN